jgi:Uma2 family endonuclease
VRLAEDIVRQPDLFLVRKSHLSQIHGHIFYGAPDWAAEVISPSTRSADEEDKFIEYAQAGIPEYWLLDPKNKTIRVYVVPEGASEYTLAATYGAGDTARSERISGFEVAVDKIFSIS